MTTTRRPGRSSSAAASSLKTFTLVLSGWAENDWASGSALDLLASQTPIDPETAAKVYNVLVQHLARFEDVDDGPTRARIVPEFVGRSLARAA